MPLYIFNDKLKSFFNFQTQYFRALLKHVNQNSGTTCWCYTSRITSIWWRGGGTTCWRYTSLHSGGITSLWWRGGGTTCWRYISLPSGGIVIYSEHCIYHDHVMLRNQKEFWERGLIFNIYITNSLITSLKSTELKADYSHIGINQYNVPIRRSFLGTFSCNVGGWIGWASRTSRQWLMLLVLVLLMRLSLLLGRKCRAANKQRPVLRKSPNGSNSAAALLVRLDF